jgi:hypothetical protein
LILANFLLELNPTEFLRDRLSSYFQVLSGVMARLAPAIHVWSLRVKDVDARHKAGHDDS